MSNDKETTEGVRQAFSAYLQQESFSSRAHPAMVIRDGVERAVTAWLDENKPAIVKAIVATQPQAEIDWFSRVPETDAEAEQALCFKRDDLIGRNLVGLFQVYRAQGESMLEAYEHALKVHIETVRGV